MNHPNLDTRDDNSLTVGERRIDRRGVRLLPQHLVVRVKENRRIEVFDASGKFLTQWPTVEGVSGLFLTKDQHIWAGGVLLDLQGKVVGRLPGANAAGGHGVAVSDSGDVYLAQLSGVVQKFVKQ